MEANEEKRPNKLIVPVIITLILVIILFLLIYFIKNRTYITPKASTLNSASIVSISNSYIFSSPVRAKINGENIRITVFLLDDKGLGVFDKKVILSSLDGSINIKDIQSLTDETGKAIFDISSNLGGTFFIEATVDGINLPQRVKVVFD